MISPLVRCLICREVLELEEGRCRTCGRKVVDSSEERVLTEGFSILLERYGRGGEPRSVGEVSQRRGISREQVRVLEGAALAALVDVGFRLPVKGFRPPAKRRASGRRSA